MVLSRFQYFAKVTVGTSFIFIDLFDLTLGYYLATTLCMTDQSRFSFNDYFTN